MKGTFKVFYMINPKDGYSPSHRYEAGTELPHDNVIFAYGDSFEKAKVNLMEQIAELPEDEEIIIE